GDRAPALGRLRGPLANMPSPARPPPVPPVSRHTFSTEGHTRAVHLVASLPGTVPSAADLHRYAGEGAISARIRRTPRRTAVPWAMGHEHCNRHPEYAASSLTNGRLWARLRDRQPKLRQPLRHGQVAVTDRMSSLRLNGLAR